MAATGSFRTLDSDEIENSNLTWKDHEPIMGSQLASHTKSKATKELGESKETTESSLKNLRRLFQELDQEDEASKRLKEQFENASDQELVKFLRARKFDVPRTLELMKGYVKYRLTYPHVFTGVNLEKLKQRVARGQPGVLPQRDNEGRVVMFFRFEDWDPVEYPFIEAVQTLVYVLEKLLSSEVTQINGLCLVEDFEGYSMTHVASVGLNDYKTMVDMLQGSFPCRFKGIHCIRQPWFFTKSYNLIKPLLKAKLFERIYIYGEELDDFYNHFPKEYLPKELGGSGPEYKGNEMVQMLFNDDDNQDDVTSL